MKRITQIILAAFFLFAGIAHFTAGDAFTKIVPPFLPFPSAIVWITGLMELLVAGALLARWRLPVTGLLLAAYLLAVLPANIYMAMENIPFSQTLSGPLLLWTRVALQFPLIALVLWATDAFGKTAP